MNKLRYFGYLSAVVLSVSVLVGGALASPAIRPSERPPRPSEPITLEFLEKNIEFKNKTNFIIRFQLIASYDRNHSLYSLKPGEGKVVHVGPKLTSIKMSGDHKYSIKSAEELKLQLKDAPENSLFEITSEGNSLKVTKK